MKIKSKKNVEIEVTDDIKCNKCTRSLKCSYGMNYEGLVEVSVAGGFGSKVLGDGERYTFSICEYCLNEIFNSFVIEPSEKL